MIAIVVGVNKWKEFTCHFVNTLRDKNPNLDILLIDNGSDTPYPEGDYILRRLPATVGYNNALNFGLTQAGKHDWYILLNNDCECTGNVIKVIEGLDPRKLYGSGENYDPKSNLLLQWSAWLVVSQAVFQAVGYFDPELEGAFEDFDYELRAMKEGYALDTANLPIIHLDKHSRFETPCYNRRWELSRLHYNRKHNLEAPAWLKC